MNWFLNFFKRKEKIIEDEMKYLIVGLGNMGAEYDGTRHNVGFEVVEHLAKDASATFKNDNLGDLATIKHKGRTLILLKPSTYMNLSGKAVRYWMQKEKIKQENLLIVVDELQLPLTKIRLRGKGSDGGHNGLKHINQTLGSNNYARLRIGIGREFQKGRQVDYVLGKWTSEELEQLPATIKKAAEAVKSFASIGLKYTMDQYNK